MTILAHNPDYKLVSTIVDFGDKLIEFAYGETNEGNNKGLEAYYYKKGEDHFYRSFRWEAEKIPKSYVEIYNSLSNHVKDCPKGHKISLRTLDYFLK